MATVVASGAGREEFLDAKISKPRRMLGSLQSLTMGHRDEEATKFL